MNNSGLGHEFIGFGFTMDERIPQQIALEFVAVKQLIISVYAMLEPEKRAVIIHNLSQVQSREMQEIVRNLKLIPAQ
ncbi:hypothetical protein [Escherichia coli]|uniref:hypothetical protein n=1 Tax=Escherichia coli TaxID=562 RepID=UPI001E488A0A|nr:hypothetical protein [Escherichia coli]